MSTTDGVIVTWFLVLALVVAARWWLRRCDRKRSEAHYDRIAP